MVVPWHSGQALTPGDRLEVFVVLEIIVLAAVGIWTAVMLLVISLCRAAKWSDYDMDTASERTIAQSPAADRTLRTLDLSRAAALLGVAPETLLAWEARYGFPTSSPSERRYNESEVLALRDNISDGASIAAAIARARERTNRRRAPTEAWVADRRDGGLAS
jgi:hypothetical protein